MALTAAVCRDKDAEDPVAQFRERFQLPAGIYLDGALVVLLAALW